MKPEAIAYEASRDTVARHSRLGDIITLAKVRVNALVVATTAGGYYMAGPAEVNFLALSLVCLGTALLASGAAAANQVYEHRTDRLMNRTRQRPVADGRMSRVEGSVLAAALALAGFGFLWTSTAAAFWVGLATFVSYVFVYTPLKRVTSLSTVVGAVPGALPPLIGWAAVRGNVQGIEPWGLFAIMFLWQLPHFLAIAWIYRDDYGRAGLPMLTVIDRHGAFTGRQAALWATALLPASQLPFLSGVADATYAVGALVLGIVQLVIALLFLRHRSIANARTLFYASIIYLPLLWILMVAGRS